MVFEILVIVLCIALMVVSLGSIISAVFHAEPDDEDYHTNEEKQ